MDFSDLHTTQRKIVEHGDGIIIVNAGPGTGKTKTLTSRVAYLINEKKVNPQNILTLTFTNRAASEMRTRLTPQVKVLPLITTFHGFCYDLLKQWGEVFEIISDEERNKIIKKIVKNEKAKLSSRDFSTRISQIKNAVTPDKILEKWERLFSIYNQELKERGCLDFDDLLQKVFTSLQKDDEKKHYLQKKYHHILIDEFQDSNEVQYSLIKLLLNNNGNLFVIGDPLQSIYSFRGASPNIFEKVKRDFSKVTEESLSINYRSAKSVVKLSKSLFPNLAANEAHATDLGHVSLIETLNEYCEADWVVNFITEKVGGVELLSATDDGKKTLVDFSDFAIIYRTHVTAFAVQKRLEESGLPYQIVKEDTDVIGDHIALLSMHAAKGLEFKYVVICGFEEGLIPHRRYDEIDEEKRLLYVAMTRAKQELYLLYARERNQMKTAPSRFQALLQSDQLVEIIDPAISKIIEKQKKNRLKKAQIPLF